MVQYISRSARVVPICLLVICYRFSSVILQDVAECSPRCWNPVQRDIAVLGSIYQEGVTDEEQCKELCVNNGTCIGIDWVRNSNQCWFQLMAAISYEATNHWSLAKCTDDCASYCWKAVKVDIHVHAGISVSVPDENRCKLLCSNTSTCRGVDWNSTSSSCWLINNMLTPEALKGIRHWDIIRNLTTQCQTNSTEYITYASSVTVGTDKVTSLTVSNDIMPNTSVGESTTYSKESTTGFAFIWETGFYVLAGLLGLCILIIIGLVIKIVRNGRIPKTKSDAATTDISDNYYTGLQRTVKGEDALYADLVQANPNFGQQATKTG